MAKKPIPQINVPIMKDNGSMELAWYLYLSALASGDKTTVSVKVNSTETTAPGTDAQVTNVGDDVDVRLKFKIPRGEQGEQGIQGPQGPQGPMGSIGPYYTNCLTEVPQNVKVEIKEINGVQSIVLKAGSRVCVPDGFENNAPKFRIIPIENDIVYSGNVGTSTRTSVWSLAADDTSFTSNIVFGERQIPNTGSGTSTPASSTQYYNTTENIIHWNGTVNTRVSSFPLCHVTLVGGVITSIDKVFDGFGYIGSTMFAVPNIKGLTPNGRNNDGTLKNISWTNSKVITRTITSEYNGNYDMFFDGYSFSMLKNTFYYDASSNYNKNDTYNHLLTHIGSLHCVKGVIDSFETKPAFHIVDYCDFQTKQDKDTALNYNYITNCITKIPQDIKLELNNGTLTLKAGSVFYAPNGAGVFDKHTTSYDKTLTLSTDGVYFVIVTSDGYDNIGSRLVSGTTSGTTPPSTGLFYNTSTNEINWYSGGTKSYQYGFPLGIITVSNGAISSIDQVFNGLGYIGLVSFILPGVRYLIPRGRNTDGTLNNIDVLVSAVRTGSISSLAHTGYLVADQSQAIADYWSVQYNPITNRNYNSNGYFNSAVLGTITTANGQVISFDMKPTFHAVDYNDMINNMVSKSGDQSIDGVKTFNDEIKGRWRTASCHTTNNFSTQQWFKLGQFKSYNTYNTHTFVFKLWVGTNDFPGVASGRVITRSGGGGTAGIAQYARIQFNHSLEWLTLSNFKILYKENQTDANGTYVLFELWAHTLSDYTGYTMSVEDERAGGEVYDPKWEFYNLPTGVASLPSGYTQNDAILARNFALDSTVVHTSGAETINDIKTFSSPINGKIDTSISSNYGSPFRTRFTLLANNYDAPSTNYSIQNCDCLANDYSYIAWAAEGRDTSGSSYFSINARNRASSSGSNRSATMGIYVDSSGGGYGYAPNTDRNNSILTTVNKSKGTNGYFKLGNGMIVQWGRVSGTIGNTKTVNFPTAFSGDYAFSVTTAAISSGASNQSQVAATASSYFKVVLGNSNVLWVAIGW